MNGCMNDIILETKGICKKFGELTANEDVNIQVRRATVHAIIGENGAGKSTLMNMIAGIYRPTLGQILIDGEPQVFRSPNDAAAKGIGMVHQEFMLYPDLTVLENMMMGFETTHRGIFLNKQKARKDIEEICQKYNFSIPLEAYARDLPVSLKQQVEIVKVLYKGAEIIILDEPTSVLTPQGIEGLFQALRHLKNMGKTIILITHKLKEVMEISDAITVLKNGHVTGNVLPSEVNEQILANMMVGRNVLFDTKKSPKQMGKPIFEVKKLRVSDDNLVEKVHDVSFSIRKGEIVGIAGVAGSGQTELVECLFGLRKPDKGNIYFEGQDITNATPKTHRLKKIGYVPQDRLATGSNVEANIMENSIMGYHIAHGFGNPVFINYKQAGDFTQKIIEQFAVKTESQKTLVGQLSGGNIQKLIVGREFLQNNDLLIIEDPTRGIDVGAIEFIWQKIIDISQQGVSILLISHELSEVMELSDRILVMYSGEIVGNLNNDENLNENTVGLYMLGGKKDEEIA